MGPDIVIIVVKQQYTYRYKASFLRSAAQLEANVCGQFKRTASVSGSQPVFNESMEFVLGNHFHEKRP